MSARFRLVLLCLALFGAGHASQAAGDWKVIKVGRWDYLSVENIAEFYGFKGDLAPVEKTIRLDNGTNQLEVMLDSREAIVNGVRNWLCFPVIEKDGKYLLSRIDLAKTIEPQFRPHLIRDLKPLKTVVIDAGHGGAEKGAGSSYGNEKEYTIDVARRLKGMLEAKGLRVIMTRSGDDLVSLPQRARIANSTKDSIFVSIHFNATDSNREASGFEIYSLTPRGAPSTQDNSLQARFANMQAGSPVDAASLILSTSVYHAMLGYMPEFDRGVKRARFAVLRLTQIPAILVEGGFLTERDESRLIAKPLWREQLAQAIAVGIDNYKRLAETKARPLRLADYRRQLDGVLVARDGNAPAPAVAGTELYPAANTLAARSAQITTPVRNQPSPLLDLNAAPSGEDEDEHPTGSQPAAASEVPSIAAADLAAPPAHVPEPATEMAPPEVESEPVTMPEAVEVGPSDAAASVPVAAVPQASPPPPVAPVQTRKYWILKFDPPPKFRQ